MNAPTLFGALEGLLLRAIEREFPKYQGCILATRVAVEAGKYFGVPVEPVAVQAVLYNAAYQRHIEAGDPPDIERWVREDGSHSVGIGFGAPRSNGWPGHLIVVGEGSFADYTIGQGERPMMGIITGRSVIGPYRPPMWKAANGYETTVEYRLLDNRDYLDSPDWKDQKRITRICGPLIREVRRLL